MSASSSGRAALAFGFCADGQIQSVALGWPKLVIRLLDVSSESAFSLFVRRVYRQPLDVTVYSAVRHPNFPDDLANTFSGEIK